MFLKVDKKILIALVVILVVILIAGFFVYKYLNNLDSNVENSIGGIDTESNNKQDTSQGQITPNGSPMQAVIKAEGTNGGGTLTVCSDKCGDGICQKEDTECNDLNCACFESPQDCPQDCK